jgi:hypothetical protein
MEAGENLSYSKNLNISALIYKTKQNYQKLRNRNALKKNISQQFKMKQHWGSDSIKF